MRLTSTDGAVVELRVVGYQFPGIVADGPDDWDANWLVIRGDVRLADGRRWHFTEPILTTWDAARLAGLLRGVAVGEVGVTPFPGDDGRLLAFTEPNLAFSLAAVDDASRTIRVHLAFESRPPWSPELGADEGVDEFFVSVRMTVPALLGVLDEWERERAAFPPR